MKPIAWTADEAYAIRGLLNDPAHALAIQSILFKACEISGLCFAADARETDFNLGRRAVGLAIAQVGTEEFSRKLTARQNKTEATEANPK